MKLMPCSKCGFPRAWIITFKTFLRKISYIKCPKCGYSTKEHWGEKKAIKEWNKRNSDR